MGIDLYDRETGERGFHANFWHWGAIVESVRRLQVLADDRVSLMSEPFHPNSGLTLEECRLIANAIRTQLLPDLCDDDRVLIDGSTTRQPDDGVFHPPSEGRDAYGSNYSTNREVLEEFASYCESCRGFEVG